VGAQYIIPKVGQAFPVSTRTGPPFYENVGVRFIEPVDKTTEKRGSDKPDPYIKNNTLYEKVLSFEL